MSQQQQRRIILLNPGDDLPVVELGKHAPISIKDWLSKPDKTVTRAEFWEMLTRYEQGRRRISRMHSLWTRFLVATFLVVRVVWRYLNQPLFEAKAPEDPQPPAEQTGPKS